MKPKEILEAYKSGKISLKEVKDQLRTLEKNASRIPLSEGQKGLWMLQKSAPDMSAYNVPICFRIPRRINIALLKQACHHVLRQYPILKSVIREENGIPYRSYQDPPTLFFEAKDLPTSAWDEILNYLKKKVQEAFSLENGPLMRVYLVSASEKEQYLLFNFHHIVFDGSSVMLFINTLMEAYGDLLHERKPEFNPDLAAYHDFVNWEQKMLSGSEGEEHRAYWQNQLSGPLPVLEIPTDRNRIYGHSFKGRSHLSKISDELGRKIKTFAQRQRVNSSVFFCGLFNILLHRYTGQEDIIVGMPTMGRPHENFYSLIGYFINMVPVRSQIKGSQSLVEYIQALQLIMADAMDHAAYPFPVLVRELKVPRTEMNSPVFQVVFAYQNFIQSSNPPKEKDKDQETLPFELVESIHQEGEYEFQLEVFEQEDSFRLYMKYNPEMFAVSAIERMMTHYKKLINEIIDAPDLAICDLEEKAIFPDQDKKIITQYNQTQEEISSTTLQQLFIEQVERTPDKIAIKSAENSITFRELHEKSNQIAAYLQQEGLDKNDFVGVLAERRIETIINLVGILKAGGAYVPIEPAYPEKRQQYMLTNSKCRIMLTPDDYVDRNIAGYPKTLKNTINNPEDVAYAIYTSGSTGLPKGVVITHKAVTNTIIDINQKFKVTEDDKIIGLSSMCFDLSVYDIFGALSTGAKLVMVPDQRNIPNLVSIMAKERITICNSVPAITGLIVENQPAGSVNTDLRLVMMSGDWIPLKLPEKIKRRFKQAEIISLGGATEASIWSIYHPITEVKAHWKSIPYGKPLANQKFHVLNTEQRQSLVNVPGELYIGGIGVAQGYLNDEEKTRNAFIKHPQLGYLYRTGDHGVMHTEGYIEFLGRKDHQVKIRGYRIELGEIEKQLSSYPAIRNATVIDFTDTNGNKYLCAYIVSDREWTTSEIRKYLAQTLPDYMIPSHFMPMEKIPLTSNGKIDRRALPQPEGNIAVGAKYIAPRNEAEAKMAGIWRDVLGVEKVGIEDDFLEMGGHSIKAIMLASRVHQEFGIELSYNQVFRTPQLKELVKFILKFDSYTGKEMNYIQFNENGTQKNIFFLPPLVPTGLAYSHLAEVLTDYSFYCFDLIESDSRIKEYANLITNIQPQGPYVIAGYSLGGFWAFETAKEMERLGHDISTVIMLDSSYAQEKIKPEDREMLIAEGRNVIDNHLDNFMDFSAISPQEKHHIKQILLEKALKHVDCFCSSYQSEGKVTCDIHLIVPSTDDFTDRPEEFLNKFSQQWDQKTSGRFQSYEGIGGHLFMMSPEFADENAQLIKQMIEPALMQN